MNRKHQKERAIALMAGNGFLLAQAFTNSDMAKVAIDTFVPVWAAIDGNTPISIALATLNMVTWMIAPAAGLWFAYSALRIADTDSQGLSKTCELRLLYALYPFALVVVLAAVVFFIRFGWPAMESVS